MHEDRDCDLWLSNRGKASLDKKQFGPWLRAEVDYSIRKPLIPSVGSDREAALNSRQVLNPPVKSAITDSPSGVSAGDSLDETTPDKETPFVEPKNNLHGKSLLGDSERFDKTLQMIDSELGFIADFVAPP